MIQSPLSFNAFLPKIHNYPRFIKRMQKLNPRALVALVDSDNDIPMIERLKGDLPNTKIVGRVVVEDTDGKFHQKPQAQGDTRDWVASPSDFMNRWGRLGRSGRTLYALNEPGTAYEATKADEVANIERLVKWTCQTLQMGTLSDTSVCALNMGTGQPGLVNGEWDPIFDPILKLPPGTWDRHLIGLHEYLPKPGRILRLKALVKRCETLKVQPPKLLITEAGWDFDPNSGEPTWYNGYRSRSRSGEIFFNDMRTLIEVDYRPYIDAGILLAVCVFCYGCSSSRWNAYDVEEDDGFWACVDGWQYVPAAAPVVVLPPATVEEPKPVPATKRYAKIVALLRELADELEQLGLDEAPVF